MDNAIYPTFAICTFFISSATVLKTALYTFGRVRRDRNMTEIQNKLLDRLGTAPDVMAYVNSDSYKKLFEAAPAGRNEYVSRILNGLQAGLVVLFMGIAIFFVSGSGFQEHDVRGMHLISSVLTAIGLGLVLSTAWSQLMLRRWGLIARNQGIDTESK